MTEVVTRLAVRADGSLAVLDQFENKMGAAGKATDRATGAVTNYEARMAKARAAMEAGNAISTQTVARRSAEQRAFDGLASSVDKSYALRIRLEREAERAAVSAANAVNMGYISNEQALSTLVALERRHAAQMSQSAAANDNLAASYRSSAAAADEAASASMRANAARSRSGGGLNQAHTTNLLFQAQDIAMMAAMGQAPMMLAMQQGMQVGGIFHQIGSGKQIVQALGGAIVGLLNPLNLATIAAIGFGAAGVQWFMSVVNSTESAATALERHNEVLDRTLEGYKAAREAADGVLEARGKAPEASVVSDLSMFRTDALERYEEILARVRAEQTAWQDEINLISQASGPDDLTSQMQRVLDIITEVGISSETSVGNLDGLHSSLTLIKNSGADAAVVAVAEAMLEMIEEARQGKAMIDSLGASMNALDRDIRIRISVSQVFEGAMSDINSLYVDPRNQFDRARDDLKLRAQAAQDAARTTSELVALASDYDRVLTSINAAEAEANKKANSKSAKAAQKPFDQWRGSVDQFRQRIASQRLDLELLGQSTYEIERQKSAFDLLNEAKQAGIPITSQVTDQINVMSAEYAAAADVLTKTTEAFNFYKGAFVGFFSDMKSGLKDGQSFWEALGNAGANALDKIADRALSMAANGLFDMLFGAVMGGIGGGFGGGAGLGMGAIGRGTYGGGGGFFMGLPSFAGGGDTGYGSRSGGLDGQGGFMAMLHPQETIIDHTRRSANQNQANDNRGGLVININGSGLSEEQLGRAIADGIRSYDQSLAPKVEAKFRTMQNDPRAADGGW